MRYLLYALCLATAAAAAGEGGARYAGRTLPSVIDEFRAAGVPLVYSSNVVKQDMYVAAEPRAGKPLEIIRQILRPHGLEIRTDAGVHVIVPAVPVDARSSPDRAVIPAPAPDIETVIVAASRYEISRDPSVSKFTIDQRTIQTMPDLGEDPIRVTQRLPGAAASGASAVAHFRGGEENEVGIMLNGQWLFDPFHIRDYHNVFSAIDARAIEGVEVYTGGFPVRYGDRMSGLVLMDTLEQEEPRHTEIGLSVFNTSLLHAVTEGERRWLLSARRGNLDLVIDPEYGQPSYFDVFGRYALDLTPDLRLSVNALYADDQVKLVLESDPAEREQVTSDTRNAQLWVRLDSRWSDTLQSSTVLAFVDYANLREGLVGDPESMIASVIDNRDAAHYSARQDWVWSPSAGHRTHWGLQAAYTEARYAYAGETRYFGLQALFGRDDVVRQLATSPRGGSYAAYVSDRWKPHDRVVIEWGLRWDDQTYSGLASDSQLSPRFNVLWRLWQGSELRLAAGRYHQSQPIQSLQIEDGVTTFWPAQRADQFVLGFRQLAGNDVSLRAEMFLKDLRDVRPRFENLYDPLGIIPELQPDRVRVQPESARARGVELSIDRTGTSWNWWASYAWSRVTDRIGGRDIPRSWDQRHAIQAGLGWRNERWDFSAAGSWHTGWPATDLVLAQDGVDADGELVYVAVPGDRNGLRYPSFSSVDLRLARRFDVSRGRLTAFLEVSNVLGRHNACCTDWDLEEGADGNPVLEVSRDYWLPLLPAIGVLWEF